MILLFTASMTVLSSSIFAQNFDRVTEFPSNGDLGFGYDAVISGNYAMFSSPFDNGSSKGVVRVFERDLNGYWNEVQTLLASDGDNGDRFGHSISIDGDFAVISSAYDSDDENDLNPLSGAGSVYVFERDAGGTWNEVQKIVASDRGMDDAFGYSVDISGNWIIVGANNEDEDANGLNTANNSGSAYIFFRAGSGIWTEIKKIAASDRATGAWFGSSVAISGNRLVIGAHFEEKDASGTNTIFEAGAAYVFEYITVGLVTTWIEVQKITAGARGAGDRFAWSVAMEGNLIVIGALQEDEDENDLNTLGDAGSAYIFERDGGGTWLLVDKIVASDRDGIDRFGYDVSISGDYILVGSWWDEFDENGLNPIGNAGSAYIFKNDGFGNWNQVTKVVATNRQSEARFGNAVSISNQRLAIGAFWQSGQQGAGYLMEECVETFGSLTVSSCISYTVPSGNASYSLTGLYEDTVMAVSGCDSIIDINLTITSVDTSVSLVNGNELTSNETGSYQWIDCGNGNVAIPGATSQSYLATTTGSYAVIVSANGCTDTSQCHSISFAGIDFVLNQPIRIYPNPANDELNVIMNNHQETRGYIYNSIGQLILTVEIASTELKIDVSILESGIYWIVIDSSKLRMKFIKN